MWDERSALFESDAFLNLKHVFWTNTALGDGLHNALLALVRAGVLERREQTRRTVTLARRRSR